MDLQKEPPQFLYRYFSNTKHVECIFRHNELYFRNPDKFNDPFDCKPLLTSERDFYEEEYIEFACGECPNEERQSCEEGARKEYNACDKNQLFKKINKIIQTDLDESINEFRVLCLTENYNDILMWSHYADGHRGFVLQFNARTLLENFKPCMFKKVLYPPQGSFPSIKDYNEHGRTSMFLIAKSSHWTYEQEWRILKHIEHGDNPKEEGKLYPFKEGLIRGIILGYKMTSEDKDKISQWRLRYQPHVEPYEAIKDDNYYNIKTLPEINE